MPPLDVTLLFTDCTADDAEAAVAAAAPLLAEAGVRAEALAVGTGGERAIAGVPLRYIDVPSAQYGDILRAAAAVARGTWLITLDAPGPEDRSLILGLWHRRHEADLLIASRYVWGGSWNMPWLRSVFSRGLNRLYSMGLSAGLRDLSSARRMYRTALLRKVAIGGTDYDVLMEVLLKVMAKGGRAVEVPWHYESAEHRTRAGTTARLIRSSLATFWRLHALRNSVGFPDYDYRAYDSRIWLQRYWQRTRFAIIREFAGHDGRLLDAGCGSSRIITTRPDMFALDIKFDRLRFLRPFHPRRLQATAGALPFSDAEFDVVISSQVIEHTPESTCIAEAVRVLKPGGVLVLGTPDYATFWWPVTEKVYGWVKRGGYAEEHITHYTFESLTAELEAAGCAVEAHRYIGGGELIIKARKGAVSER